MRLIDFPLHNYCHITRKNLSAIRCLAKGESFGVCLHCGGDLAALQRSCDSSAQEQELLSTRLLFVVR